VSRSVKVTIAGHRFSVRTDAKPQYIRELANFVNHKLETIKSAGKAASSQSTALLLAMTLADELYQVKDRQDRLEREVRQRTSRILKVLEQEAEGTDEVSAS
jgi:cell division protein ZapA